MSLRAKVLLGLSPLLVALAVTVVVGSKTTTELAHSSWRIINENYLSVVAAQRMKVAVERLDRAAVLRVSGSPAALTNETGSARTLFDDQLRIEDDNITEPGEAEAAARLGSAWQECERRLATFLALEKSRQSDYYFGTLSPQFVEVDRAVDAILDMNQDAMLAKSASAEREARRWNRIVIAVGTTACVLALVASIAWTSRLLRPLGALGSVARRIGQGDLGARTVVRGNDEVALLAKEIDDMADKLQKYRKSSLGELLQAQQNLQAAIDGMPDPLLLVRVDGALDQVNAAAETALDIHPGRPTTKWLEALPSRLRDAIEKVRTHIQTGKGRVLPTALEDAIGVDTREGPRRFLARGVPTYDAEGAITGTTILLQDVTRIVRMDELRADLVATVAHEFRTPLTSIRMAIHLCAEGMAGALTEKQADLLHTARDECERLQTIVDELLAASRLNAGKLVLHRASVPVEVLLDGAVAAVRTTAETRQVQLRTEAMPGVGDVWGDRDQLNIVLSNLLTNAVSHSPLGGSVVLGARRAGGVMEIDVRDQGPGLAKEYQRAVFEPNFQAPGGHPGSAGLGLAIARRIMQEHGGEIGVDSDPGRGARFWIRLPSAVPKTAA